MHRGWPDRNRSAGFSLSSAKKSTAILPCLQLAQYPIQRKCYGSIRYWRGSLFLEAVKPLVRSSHWFTLHLSFWSCRKRFCCPVRLPSVRTGTKGIPYDPLVASAGVLHGFVQPAIAAPHSAVRGRHGIQLQQDRSLCPRGAASCGQA